MIRNSTLKLFFILILFFLTSIGNADLEWINGGVPKSSTDKTALPVVRDAPDVESHTIPQGNQDVVICHMITCTKLANEYPTDSVNYFYLNKNDQICYYAYFLIKPSSRIHTAMVECYSPSNLCIAKFDKEFRVGFTDRLLTIQNETYQWFLVDANWGMDHLNAQCGQTGLPRDVGLYTVHLTVDGQLAGITFFYVKSEPTRNATPIATIAPAPRPPASGLLPMNTPVSNFPIPQGLH